MTSPVLPSDTGQLGPGVLKVGATGAEIDVSCYVNNARIEATTDVGDPTTKLCAPIAYTLGAPAAGNYIFNLPMPANCCITSKAFLEINFVAGGAGCSTSTTRPRLITDQSCDPCTSYNIYPAGNDDLCADVGFPGNPIMYVDGDCCSTTPADHATWGQLKGMYR